MKTKKQEMREQRHNEIVNLYKELSQEGGSRMAMWEELEQRTGYSRPWLVKILTRNGVINQKTNKYGAKCKCKSRNRSNQRVARHTAGTVRPTA
ncbi:MAG: hypothetical protein IKP37_02520 [Paludibacteraceae bacterium]|nr:hypothetical protein [Paludibacteraceae bacterium]